MTTRASRQVFLDGLRAFSVAGRHLSFKAAADALYVTPSAVSHRIRDLEKHLGQRLFVRKIRAIELTDEGRALLDDVEPLLAALDRVVERANHRSPRRVLKITAPPFIANELLVPNLRSFYTLEPRIDLQITTTEVRAEDRASAPDASIVISDQPPVGVCATRLFAPRFVAATARSLALAAREQGGRVFDRHRRIVCRSRPGLWGRWFAETGLSGSTRSGTIEVDSLPSAVAAAEGGLGIALVPTFVCERRLRGGRLMRVVESEIDTGDAYYLVCRHEDRSRPELRALMSWALSELRR